ncbi:C40 family peptidase [Psychrobacillus sp. FSL H8-0484]|uniref:C40 family peptidase n=1 Tax=Psychrobacillus sp. FSL H8-0484 TaxID=2921390 RepID=UPI0030F8C1C6
MFKKILKVCLLSSSILLINTTVAGAASPNEIKTQAHTYIGVPYLYGGTTTQGFDCSGFVQQVFQDLEIDIPRDTKSQYQIGTSVSKSDLEVGDLVFFNTTGNGVSHVGIYIGANQFISSATSKGVSVASINDPYYWGDKYIGAKRVEEVKSASIDMSIYASRAEVAQKLADTLKLSSTDSTIRYKDVKATSDYFHAINAVTEAKIFSGTEDGKFNPSKPITRAHVAKVLVEAFDLKPGNGTFAFTDVNSTHWASEYVQILAQNGITIGKPDGSYGLNDYVTNKQMNTFLERIK